MLQEGEGMPPAIEGECAVEPDPYPFPISIRHRKEDGSLSMGMKEWRRRPSRICRQWRRHLLFWKLAKAIS